MERKRVNSSKLRSVGYDEKTLTLDRRFMAAPNPTAFFDDKIDEEYTGRRV